MTGTELFLIGGGLVALYFLVRFLKRLLERAAFLGTFQAPLKRGVFLVDLLFEPIVLFILSIALVLYSPEFFGLMFLAVFILGFTQFRNYFSGILVQVRQTLRPGQRIQHVGLLGIISDMERLGLFLQTTEGKHFVNYSRLLSEGYTLISGQEMSGYFQLQVDVSSATHPEPQYLRDLLLMAPYLDSHFKPELVAVEGTPHLYRVKVLLRDENHLKELEALIQEQGYQCKREPSTGLARTV